MKRMAVAALIVLGVFVAVPALGQGENVPRIVDIRFEIERFTGTLYGTPIDFGLGLYPSLLLGEWAAPVAFNPNIDVAHELDFITVYLTVVDADFTAGNDNKDITFFENIDAMGSTGPPEAPSLYGQTYGWRGASWYPIAPPPANAVELFKSFLVPEFTGVSQDRMTGRSAYDIYYLVTWGVANDENPEEGSFDEISFFFGAIENPLLLPPNPRPFADAGPNQVVVAGSDVVLDAGRSFDSSNLGFDPNSPDVFAKDNLDFLWEWVSGPERVDPAPLDAGTAFQASVRLTEVGDYVYRVLVDDNQNPLPSTDLVTISVVASLPENRGPRAVITVPHDTVAVGGVIELRGTSSRDPDGDTLTYRWRQTNELGERLLPDETVTQFQPLNGLEGNTVRWRATEAGTYYFALMVTDPGGLTDAALTSVRVTALATTTAAASHVNPNVAANAALTDTTEDQPTRTSTGACGAGGLAPLALTPVVLLLIRGRRHY
jgi:hypothetical protein